MGKQILVKSPLTSDGTTPIMIAGVQQYKETILEAAAREGLERINQKLPDHLKKVITDYNPENEDTQEEESTIKKVTKNNVKAA